MSTIVRDSCIRIPIDESKGTWWFNKLVLDLRRKERAHNAEPEDAPIIKYYYGKDMDRRHLMIPRYYPLRGIPYVVDDVMPDGQDIDITSNIVPRNDRQKETVEYITNSDQGVICLSPGEGKTVISIHSICQIGKRAIIFVHKDSLADQWKQRFLEFTDIKEDQIARLKTSKFEQQVTNYPIVISTVQTFCSAIDRVENFYDIIRTANFGVAFWDECHTSVSAESFSKSSLHLPCRRTFGLSATPKRLDGNTDIMNYHLGSVFEPFAQGIDTMVPKVVLLKFDHGVMKSKKANWVMHSTGWDKNKGKQPKFDRTRYLTQLCKSKTYKDKIRLIINQISKTERKALFLADRIDILDEAAKGCVNKAQIGFFIPRSGKERDEHLKRKMVFSTYGSARDGTDKKELDCLILATSTSNLEQAAGRVVRSAENKQQPVIFDFVDIADERFINKAKKRIEYYQSKGWPIEEKLLK
jgi:superfamily II DNA or RNA helicase